MRLPLWYIFECIAWAFSGLPFYVLGALYTGRLWPIPDPPSEYLPVWQWLLAMLFIYHPFLLLPLALIKRRAKAANAPNH